MIVSRTRDDVGREQRALHVAGDHGGVTTSVISVWPPVHGHAEGAASRVDVAAMAMMSDA